MADIILRAEGLGKRYRLGAEASLGQTLRAAAKRMLGRPAPPPNDFWALSDVDFEIERGGVVGVIGRNGAGKSTLLKILSRITSPTTGRIRIDGRVSSLLEVGTGFHPDLTGRENIYMNGAILGMNRREIARKFDEIVAFAEIDGFLDTPIKRYSSGMYVRLAFAVSAHLEPDILVLDEVLAVGDAGFQRKCLGKMSEVAGHGRTVLFVSHNLPTVLALCSRCLYLEKGRLVASGPTAEIAALYQQRLAFPLDGGRSPQHVAVRQRQGPIHEPPHLQPHRLRRGMPVSRQRPWISWMETAITAEQPIADAEVGVPVYSSSGERLVDARAWRCETTSFPWRRDNRRGSTSRLRNVLLNPATYTWSASWLGRSNVEDIDACTCAGTLVVEPDPNAQHGAQRFPGFYLCPFTHDVVVGTATSIAA